MMVTHRALGLLAASVLVLPACSSGSSDFEESSVPPESTVTSAPAETSESVISVYDLKPGDCFDDELVGGEVSEDILTVPIVDCVDPHDNEVFAIFDAEGVELPVESQFEAEAIFRCTPLFEEYVGASYETSRLDFWWAFPQVADWASGDREMMCVLVDMNLEKLTGSMKNSGE